ncbi:UDP-D-apiose/UDP-D-xylose synthase-like isoform X5 [Ananas comosus]|uniref:UDP-D-apiose/UDP-D-xylose synthase-like isoform X5 n=1 Tax=Ananas comosus TaxID=4615 RepID=A0A6P5F139_ANACO|nr:UDP-D-apiose/UDP-D-xylose synthase-like isoform X5 [Ananas comosus]
MEHFGKTVRANQRCAEEVSAVLSGVGRRCHPPHLPPPGARRRRLRKIKNLLGPPPEHRRIQFHRLNIKNDARLVGLIKTLDLMINRTIICIPAYYNTRPLGTVYSNFMDALPVVKYCSENNKRLIHFSTCEVYGNAIGSFPPKDHSLLQVNKFFRFAVVDGVSFA